MAALVITATDVVQTAGESRELILAAGVTATRGLILTKNADGEGVVADVSSANLAGGGTVNAGLFMALSDGGPGQKISVAVPSSQITLGTILTKPVFYYLGASGTIVLVADLIGGNYKSLLGYATSTSNFVFQTVISEQTV